jgi:hypothetical protein
MGANQPAPKNGCSSLRDLIGVRAFCRYDRGPLVRTIQKREVNRVFGRVYPSPNSDLDFISSEHKKHTGLDGA